MKQKKKKKASKEAAQRIQQEKLALEQQRLARPARVPARPAYDEEEEEPDYQRVQVDEQEEETPIIHDEDENVDISVPPGSNCPRGFTLCPIARGSDSGRYDFGCFDTRTSVNMCGGCAGVPEAWSGKTGVDCLSIPGVVSSACVESQCRICRFDLSSCASLPC